MSWQLLGDEQAETLDLVCEAVVPGSRPVGPVAYLDAAVGGWPEPQRGAFLQAVDDLAPVRERGPGFLAEVQATPAFGLVRAMAIEAYYSDWAQPGYDGPTAWDEIDFNSPLARRLHKDFGFLGGAR
jgi:hypothetical protein